MSYRGQSFSPLGGRQLPFCPISSFSGTADCSSKALAKASEASSRELKLCWKFANSWASPSFSVVSSCLQRRRVLLFLMVNTMTRLMASQWALHLVLFWRTFSCAILKRIGWWRTSIGLLFGSGMWTIPLLFSRTKMMLWVFYIT